MELDSREDGAEIQKQLGKLTGASSVPRVFIGGKSVGGHDDIMQLHQKGLLQKTLQEVGVPFFAESKATQA
jgi:glutaredoxin 3